ncbi:N-succinylarginine dihydrolase [Ketobacter sp.]|uniref:N-succinylarginine dihydrolase n=1 Tax=Ketobacter sp. TaxID=2083498 RepID=UPI000F207EDA|nr:N-succinylarginine dihydrolase [Ketobacter sp.]RLT97006.1 MAG: N-succinylarginine dihydrolase [Ketobacter sp.]
MRWREVNFDGLVGPTHNYAGLSFGNLASVSHQGAVSNPRQAALQGLSKMRWLMDRGFVQGVLPPQLRPNLAALRQLGFQGPPPTVLRQAWQQAPQIFSMCCSASAMWVANAATVFPSCDHVVSQFKPQSKPEEQPRCVVVPANLISHFHRSQEVAATSALLHYVFADARYFQVQSPLPAVSAFGDEGAANHMRIGLGAEPALHVLVYGSDSHAPGNPKKYPSRQTREASAALARLSGLHEDQVILVKQSAEAIDAGVFHNDVIAVSHEGLLLCHEKAFHNQDQVLQELTRRGGDPLRIVEVKEAEVSVTKAVSTYLFNSQLLGEAGQRTLLLPAECEQDAAVKDYIEHTLKTALDLQEIAYLDLQQSMRNGGGPACLRLRITLSEVELGALQGKLILDDERHQRLVDLVAQRYPQQMLPEQLAEWDFAREMQSIVEDIYRVLELPLDLLQPFQ